GRGIVPKVDMPVTLSEAADRMKSMDLCFAPYECETENKLKPVLLSVQKPLTAGFIIGPEGGFEISEIEALRAAGIPGVTLGKRILRTETAGEAVLSMLMYEIGDINN
ncbi:MAG: RNA methyltransferase, partial [Oscillospiraceae bacterium]|nr:RNA methyltransferase [Oscillospiraceae bacterium]